MVKEMTIVTQMKALKRGEIIRVEYDPENIAYWYGCPNCGTVNREDEEYISSKNNKLSTKSGQGFQCYACGNGCGMRFEIADNVVNVLSKARAI